MLSNKEKDAKWLQTSMQVLKKAKLAEDKNGLAWDFMRELKDEYEKLQNRIKRYKQCK